MKKLLCGWFGLALFGTGLARASTYELDMTHTNVLFKVKHLVISTVTGRFNDFKGNFEFDEKTGNLSNLSTEIKSTSIDTNEKDRDKHLRGGDFFDVEKFPTITFKAKKVETKDKKPTKITGDLTIRGKTKEIVLDVDFKGSAKDPWGNEKVAFEATGTLNRKDFGVSWNKSLDSGGVVVSDEVKLVIEVEANKKK